jgi:hypothetical protein
MIMISRKGFLRSLLFAPFAKPVATKIFEAIRDYQEPFHLTLVSVPIVARTRKLKTVWTCEFEQDLNAYHSIKAEKILTEQLKNVI